MTHEEIKQMAEKYAKLQEQLEALKKQFEPLKKTLLGLGEYNKGGVSISVEVSMYEERKGVSTVKETSEELYNKMRALGLIYTNERHSLKVRV
jgi:uncharacterized coiled-coil DUF342 family protein